tara:strand:- start:764 stop:1546 length:783 start_codon:yes stop_codon:yes gene_type:complete
MSEQKVVPEKPQEKNMISKASEQQILDSILEHMPSTDTVDIDLPSKNRFYVLQDPAKKISLRPMTFEDERAMMSNKNAGIDTLNLLLSRCASNIDVGQLLQMDKLFLIMKLREISYGEDYNVSIDCTACKKENKITFQLNKLPVRYLEDHVTNPVEVTLPILKKTIKITLPRVTDEKYFGNPDIAIQNMWRFVEEIDGHTEKAIISKVIPKLPLQDAHVVMEALAASDYGLDTKVKFRCHYCTHTEVMELPITADFFTGK